MLNPPSTPLVLIVDDEPVSVEMLKDMLEGEYRVVMAHGGQEALDIIAREAPDLVLLDILMPLMDGYEVFRTIRLNPDHATMPILFITAMGEAECEHQGLELGAGDYIVKPFNPALVRLRVKNHLQLKQQRDQLAARTEELQRLNAELAREVEERRIVQAANEKLIYELREAMTEVKALSALLPICASCKKVRDDQGYWSQIETYLSKHTDITFSHGLCTDCAQKLYPSYHLSEQQDKNSSTPT